MDSEPVYLGIDGGASKTAALVIDAAGHILGTGYSGESNYQVCGLETATHHIREAAVQALAGRRAAVGAFCLSGADMRYDFSQLEPVVFQLNLCDQAFLYNDTLAVFRAGSTRPYGVGIVCGTGFNAVGVSQDGREFRLPALGEMTGDRVAGGSGLGMGAMGAAFRSWDGRGEPTRLLEMVLSALQAPDMPTLAEWIAQHRITQQQILDLTPLVFTAASEGDRVASELIREQGCEIARTILAFLRQLDLLNTPCDVVLGGGVFYGKGNLLMDGIHESVYSSAPHAALKRLDVKPVVGATLLAVDRAGIVSDDTWIRGLRERLPGDLKISLALDDKQ